jgi:hypothetical protein
MKKILLLLLITSCAAFAQITITDSDIESMFAIGNNITVHSDTLESSVDIGSAGGGNNWDFSSLASNLTVDLMCIDPVSSPYINDFTGAEFCTHTTSTFGGNTSEAWTFSTLNGYYDNMGSASIVQELPGFVTMIKNDPFRHAFMNPTTFNTQWTQTYTQTTYLNGTPFGSSSVSLNTSVDAYGSMTLPGGASYEALRIREEVSISGFTNVNYTFIAKNGAQVSLSATVENPPNSGVIDVIGTSYNSALNTSSVEQFSTLPGDYNLNQNYPNPFNPSTNIEYSIPEASFVQLKVYDILGNEIALLVNEEQSAGAYRADFTAANLASGFYIAQLKAGKYTKTIKMTLLK